MSEEQELEDMKISLFEILVTPIKEHPCILEPIGVQNYSSAFHIQCSRPISIQKGKQTYVEAGIVVTSPQPVDKTDTETIVSPYHMEWRVEPYMPLLQEQGIWAHGSSNGSVQAMLSFNMINLGSKIYNASAGDILAVLQFYLAPKLRIKGITV